MIDISEIGVFLGLDAGKGEHHATALTPVRAASSSRWKRAVVRNIRTGDVFWTDDHYGSFHYMGRH